MAVAAPQQPMGTGTAENNSFQLPGNLGKIKGMMNMLRSGGNPQAMMQGLMQNNPQMGAVMELVNQHGGDARAAFYDLARQKGVDPNQILNMLK